jgi:hypothetical protein
VMSVPAQPGFLPPLFPAQAGTHRRRKRRR